MSTAYLVEKPESPSESRHVELRYYAEPTPHIHIPQVLPPDVAKGLIFPTAPVTPRGRSGHDIYRGDAQWDIETAKPGWHDLAALLLSKDFVLRVISLFADDIRRLGGRLDPDKAQVSDYIESWEENFIGSFPSYKDPNELFMRFDFQAAGKTYTKPIHCDWIRRVVGGMVFISDSAEQGMEGGDFALYRDLEFANDRVCHKPELAKTFRFRRNEAVLFLNANVGFHGPLPITNMRENAMRQWIYYSISGRQDAWLKAPAS